MFTSTNADKRKAKCAKCHYHNNDYIQVSLYSNAPNAFKSNKSRKQITNHEKNPRPACKVFLTSEVLRGLGGRKGTQRVIYKSLAKVSGSDDNVPSILVFCICSCSLPLCEYLYLNLYLLLYLPAQSRRRRCSHILLLMELFPISPSLPTTFLVDGTCLDIDGVFVLTP